MSIGERLREERERLGVTQPALAELVKSSKRTVIDWEKGVSYPNALALSVMASSGVDVGYVLTGAPSTSSLRPDEVRLLVLYRLAEASVQSAVVAALAAGSTGPLASRQKPSSVVVVHGDVGQTFEGDNNAPQTINMGGSRSRRRTP